MSLNERFNKGHNTNSFLFLLLLFIAALGCSSCATDPYSSGNRAYIILNSEPQGARVYEDGKFIGTTPIGDGRGWYLTQDIRNRGKINSQEFVFVFNGYLPIRKQYSLNLDPPGQQRYFFHDVVLLERDPSCSTAGANL